MRINPDDPFFNSAPLRMGFEIKPGQTFVLCYSYVVSDGPPDTPELDRLWNDYANRPRVTITLESASRSGPLFGKPLRKVRFFSRIPLSS